MYDSANRLVSAGGHTYTYNAEMVVNMVISKIGLFSIVAAAPTLVEFINQLGKLPPAF